MAWLLALIVFIIGLIIGLRDLGHSPGRCMVFGSCFIWRGKLVSQTFSMAGLAYPVGDRMG